MIKKLKIRSTAIFSLLNISLFSLIIILLFLISKNQIYSAEQELAETNFANFINTFHITGTINQSELDGIKEHSHMDIYVEDNNTPLLLSNTFNQTMIDECKQILTNMGQVPQVPFHFLYSKNGKEDTRVFSQKTMGLNNNEITFIAFQNREIEFETVTNTAWRYLLIGLLANCLIILISYLLATISTKPTERALEAQKRFIASSSHEIRTPLAVIDANLSALELQPKQLEYYVSIVKGEVKQLSRLANDLTEIAYHETDKWQLKKTQIEVDTLLMELHEAYLPMAKGKKQKLILELPSETMLKILADEERLKQVLSILLNNAMQYSNNESVITLGAYQKNKSITLFVSDNGLGVPPHEQDKIFESFYQIDKARKDKNHFGLGLSIAKELIEKHGGKLEYKDTDGGGATFNVIL